MKLYLGILCSISAVWGGDTSTATIRDAAAKAVTLIQKSQKNWYVKQSCYSCHQQSCLRSPSEPRVSMASR